MIEKARTQAQAHRVELNLKDVNLVVSDPGVVAAGWAEQVLASVEEAGLKSTLFTQVTPNPRIEEANAGATVYAEQGCDVSYEESL
jgi:alcohol dehydrogenase class IV